MRGATGFVLRRGWRERESKPGKCGQGIDEGRVAQPQSREGHRGEGLTSAHGLRLHGLLSIQEDARGRSLNIANEYRENPWGKNERGGHLEADKCHPHPSTLM